MRLRTHTLLFTAVLAANLVAASAFAQPSARVGAGFFSPDSARLPEPVRRASASVYRLHYPNGAFRVVDVNDSEAAAVRASGNIWTAFQYEVCRMNRLNHCPIFEEFWRATGFKASGDDIISTNLHVVQNWIFRAKAANPEVKIRDLINPILISRDQTFLQMPTQYGEFPSPIGACRLSFFNEGRSVWSEAYERGTFAQRVSDYVELKCDHSLPGPRLKIVSDLRDEPVYPVGYVGRTAILAKHGGVDADGRGLWLSSGYIVTPDFASTLNVRINAPGGPGLSGGPALNANGEVVGIVFAGTLEDRNGTVFAEAQVLRILFDAFQSLWPTLER